MLAKLLPTIFGVLMVAGAVMNWEYFLRWRGLNWIEGVFGRNVQRGVVALLGATVAVSPWAFL